MAKEVEAINKFLNNGISQFITSMIAIVMIVCVMFSLIYP